jgi:uridine kinase
VHRCKAAQNLVITARLASWLVAVRRLLIERVAAAVDRLRVGHPVRVGVDGVDGAGKTVFADELAAALAERGRPVIRAGVDSFHNPRELRYRLGRHSPEGYFRDSYDYERLRRLLLEPLGPGGTGRYRTAAFDHRTDREVIVEERVASPHAVLVFDGIFLHRAELRVYWDYSVFLRVGFDVSVARCAQRDQTAPSEATNRRYVEGQRLYLRECEPERLATAVVDNNDVHAPFIVSG